MDTKRQHQIDYVEFAAYDLAGTEHFFSQCFDWQFTHYGEDYMDSNSGGLMLGFYRAKLKSQQAQGGAMVALYTHDIKASQTLVESAGGNITKEIFSFPGGCRFQFTEPSGNEFAIWSTQSEQ